MRDLHRLQQQKAECSGWRTDESTTIEDEKTIRGRVQVEDHNETHTHTHTHTPARKSKTEKGQGEREEETKVGKG